MTSIPASRSAAATTFAPRSCPSRPGLAIRTRMGRITHEYEWRSRAWRSRSVRQCKLSTGALARQLALARHEQHLGGAAGERCAAPAIVCFLHDQACSLTELGDASGRVEANAMLALAARALAAPVRANREDP